MTASPSGASAPPPMDDAPWRVARAAEAHAGEVRINLLRLLAIAVFYGYHLINYYVRRIELSGEYHLTVTAIAVSWVAAAVLIHIALSRSKPIQSLQYWVVGWDALMATTLIVFSSGPRSPFLLLLFLILLSAPLRLDLPLVWFATLAAALSYGAVCGNSKWVRPETQVPVEHHVIFLLGLGAGGLFAGQSVRQALRLARDYADRVVAVANVIESKPAVADAAEESS